MSSNIMHALNDNLLMVPSKTSSPKNNKIYFKF